MAAYPATKSPNHLPVPTPAAVPRPRHFATPPPAMMRHTTHVRGSYAPHRYHPLTHPPNTLRA